MATERWGVQIGLSQGYPVLLDDGAGHICSFSSQEAADKVCADRNAAHGLMRSTCTPVDLNALDNERLDDGDFASTSSAEQE